MLRVTIIALGKIKDRWITSGIEEYSKRLGRYCKLDIIELPEGRLPQNPNTSQISSVLEKESNLILNAIPAKALVVGLFIDGKQLSSEKLASLIDDCGHTSSNIVFIIGSSHGLSQKVQSACSVKLSFSALTFPHQLMRLILTEQIYRAFSILNNSSYHK